MIREIQVIGESPPDKSFKPETILPPDPPEPDGEDYKKVLQRQDDIDQLTAEYISALVYPELDREFDFEPDMLEMIENRFEQILADEFGIFIYRPAILTLEDGSELLVESIYDEIVDEDFE